MEKNTNIDYNLLYDGIGSIGLVDRNWITDTTASAGKTWREYE